MTTTLDVPQGVRVVPRFTYEVTEGMTIAQAIAHADTIGGDWTILVYPGTYNEGDLTPNGGANITLKGMGRRQIEIVPGALPATATIVSAHTLTIENILITAFDATVPAVAVTAGLCRITECQTSGVGAGDAIAQTGGELRVGGGSIPAGDIDLSSAACTLRMTGVDIHGTIDVAGAFAHDVEIRHSDLRTNNINLAGAGATFDIESCNDIGNITDASTVGIGGNGRISRCDVTGNFVKNGTTPWVVDNCAIINVSNTGAAGGIAIYGGVILGILRAVSSIVWWQDNGTLKVIPSGDDTDTIIQWAVNAAGVGDTVLVHPGTYQEAVTLTAGRNLVGVDRGNCIIYGTDFTLVTMAAGCRVSDLTLNVTAVAGNAIGVECNDATCTIEDLNINMVWTNGNAYGIVENTGATARVINIRNVRITSDTDSNEFGIYIQRAGKTVYIEECWIQGGDIGVAVIEDSDVFMYHNRVEVNVRPTGGGAAIYTNHADAVIRMHGDTIDGVIHRALGVITYKNNAQQYEVWQGAYDCIATTTLRHGMLIQDAITAAAAETPAPGTDVKTTTELLGYVTYTVLIHPGIYDEAVTCTEYVNLKGIGPKGSVVIYQNDANVLRVDNNVHLQNFTVRLGTLSGARALLYDHTAMGADPIRVTDLIFEIVTPEANVFYVFNLNFRGAWTIERCSCNIGGTGAGMTVRQANAGTSIHLIDNDFTLNNVNAKHIAHFLPLPLTGSGNRWAGTCGMFNVTAGTLTFDNDAMICTGPWTNTGSTIILRNCAIEAPVVAGDTAIVRMKNCSYRAISRTGTGNIVDEGPDLKDAPWHIERWNWIAALANAQVAVRGGAVDGGSGQIHLPVTDGAAATRSAAESLGEVAGTLGTEFTPAKTPRFITQISVDSFALAATNIKMFFGLRETKGDNIPVANEDHAGFEWDGAAWNAVNCLGANKSTQALTTPAAGAHVQLEVIVFGGHSVEFYIGGVLVHTETNNIPAAVLDWQHLTEALGNDSGNTVNVTVRPGGCQECPA